MHALYINYVECNPILDDIYRSYVRCIYRIVSKCMFCMWSNCNHISYITWQSNFGVANLYKFVLKLLDITRRTYIKLMVTIKCTWQYIIPKYRKVIACMFCMWNISSTCNHSPYVTTRDNKISAPLYTNLFPKILSTSTKSYKTLQQQRLLVCLWILSSNISSINNCNNKKTFIYGRISFRSLGLEF